MSRIFTVFFVLSVSMLQSAYAQRPWYECGRVHDSITIDGILNEPSWQKAWAVPLLEAKTGTPPDMPTTVRAMWDSTYLYVSFYATDNNITGTLTERDDNLPMYDEPLEVFIDPDGDGLNYYEFEWNCLNTAYDLFLEEVPKYPDTNHIIHTEWNSNRTLSAVQVLGTANNSRDTDTALVLEAAISWADIDSMNSISLPPKAGDSIRINIYRYNREKISRVEHVEYSAWSPPYEIAFHRPNMFGSMIFTDTFSVVGIKNRPKKSPAIKKTSINIDLLHNERSMRISYQMLQESQCLLALYNAFGQKLRTIDSGVKKAGLHTIVTELTNEQGRPLARGLYWVSMSALGSTESRIVSILN